jgi:hypothetical protein
LCACCFLLLLLLLLLQRELGNVVVFLGNEGPLGIPQQPIVFENARRLNALVVLVEHRYYGEQQQRRWRQRWRQQQLYAMLLLADLRAQETCGTRLPYGCSSTGH